MLLQHLPLTARLHEITLRRQRVKQQKRVHDLARRRPRVRGEMDARVFQVWGLFGGADVAASRLERGGEHQALFGSALERGFLFRGRGGGGGFCGGEFWGEGEEGGFVGGEG